MSDDLAAHIERGGSAAVAPLEIWHLPVDGEPVSRRLGTPAVAAMREQGVEEAEIGRFVGALAVRLARRLGRGDYASERFLERQRLAAEAVRGCRRFVFAGGLTRLAGFQRFVEAHEERASVLESGGSAAILRGAVTLVRRHPCRRSVGRHPCRPGTPGTASHLCDARDGVAPPFATPSEDVVVIDVGQTALKAGVLRRGSEVVHVERFERPLDRLPVDEVDPECDRERPERREAVEAAIEFIAEAIRQTKDVASDPSDTVVLALPCALDDDLWPSACTYPGWEHAPDLVERIARRAGLEGADDRLIAVNDAELAGHAVVEQMDEAGRQDDTLVMTLGFGPGGAYVEMEDRDGG